MSKITTKIVEQASISVDVHRSPIDGALIVQIDTQENTGRVRIYLNDGEPLFFGDPEGDS